MIHFDFYTIANSDGEILWQAQEGPQQELFDYTHDPAIQAQEILYGGARGGGKTSALVAWMAAHVDNPGYRGLILRKTNESLKEFIDTAWVLYKKMGARQTGRPTGFEWPNGAHLYTGHFKDERSLEDYKGHEYHRIGLEEASQIASEKMYEALLGSNRSTVKGILSRILLTTNPDGVGNCLDAGEVLTPSGWKDIKDFSVGDPVFTVQPNGQMTETVVSQVIAAPYEGNLCRVDLRGFSMSCTPNHSVPKLGGTRTDPHKLFTLTPFDELPGQAQILRTVDWVGTPIQPHFILPHFEEGTGKKKSRLQQPDSVRSDLFFQLMGWFLAEGHTLVRDNSFGLSQRKKPGVEAITALMGEIGFTGKWNSDCFIVHSQKWCNYFKQFGKQAVRFIPDWMKNSDKRHLELLFYAIMDGDGHWEVRGKSGQYYSTSKQLSDDVAEIAVRLGYHVYSSDRMPSSKGLRSYMVNFKTNGSRGVEFRTNQHVYDVSSESTKPTAVEHVPFNGTVYCLGIADTHTFVVRQNGAVWVSGNSWLQKRFIKVYQKGILIKPKTAFYGENKKVRVFIPAKITDNQILMERDPGYYDQLNGIQNEALRRAWLLGDWDCQEGAFFPEFRPNGPYAGEPDRANHVIPAHEIPTWCHRWGALDWGYAHHAAGYWGAFNIDKRTHVYREMMVRNMAAEEVGSEYARRSIPDLEGIADRSMVVYLSHDAFSARNAGKSIAEQVKVGIERILGPGSCYLLGKTEEERKLASLGNDKAGAEEMFAERFNEQFKNARIVLKRSGSDRVAAASVARSFFQWRVYNEQVEPDMVHARRLMEQVDGYRKYTAYMKKFDEQQKAPPVPNVQIHDCCQVLIETIPQLRPDPNDLEKVRKFHGDPDKETIGDDPWDGFAYLLMGASEQQNALPYSEFMSREVLRHLGTKETDINLKIQVARQAHDKFNKQTSGAVIESLTRDSMRSRWHN